LGPSLKNLKLWTLPLLEVFTPNIKVEKSPL